MIKSKIVGRFIVVTLVILSYVIFALPNIKHSEFSKLPRTHYQFLTQGFLSGHLDILVKPAAELLKLPNPYDPEQNLKFRLSDVSLYNNKFYLYFGPLPVFAFFMPFKLLTNLYPPPALGVLLFISIGFILNFLLLIKIKKSFTTISEPQLNFLGLILGFANGCPFLFFTPRVYELAVSSVYCFMSAALYFLYPALKQFKTRYAALFAIFSALTVAGRPHFALAVIALVPIIAIYFIKYAPKNQLKKLLLSLFLPVLCIGLMLGAYNYLRFDSFLEFGHKYQLAIVDFTHDKTIRTDFYRYIPIQIYYYFIQPFFINLPTPHVPEFMEPLVKNMVYESALGILASTPIVLFILMTRTLIRRNTTNMDSEVRPILWLLGATTVMAAMIVAVLISVSYTAQRYEVDFLPYLIIASILNVWLSQEYTQYPQALFKISKPFFMFTGIISIVLGLNFGMLSYGSNYNFYMISQLSILLFFLMPAALLLMYFIRRSIKSIC